MKFLKMKKMDKRKRIMLIISIVLIFLVNSFTTSAVGETCNFNEDCASGEYCRYTGFCAVKISDGTACVGKTKEGTGTSEDEACSSGYCDNDGVGTADDNWCFTPYNTYFDGQENTYCEYSTNAITSTYTDEKIVGTDLNRCIGLSYREDEVSSTCETTDRTDTFECTDTGCSCTEPLCDNKAIGGNIVKCGWGTTWKADQCTSTAGGEDRSGSICRSSAFAADCTASSACNGYSEGNLLNTCNQVGQTYYEDYCPSCSVSDYTSVFECTDTGCSCTEPLCDGKTSGTNIVTCATGNTWEADKCTSTAGGTDRGDNTCRSSAFAAGCSASSACNNQAPSSDLTTCNNAGQTYFEDSCSSSCIVGDKNTVCRSSAFAASCTADSQCNGVTAGTGQCTSSCTYDPDPCLYSGSGDWNIGCSNDCILSSAKSLPSNNFIATGSGTVTITANIDVNKAYIMPGCKLYIKGNGKLN